MQKSKSLIVKVLCLTIALTALTFLFTYLFCCKIIPLPVLIIAVAALLAGSVFFAVKSFVSPLSKIEDITEQFSKGNYRNRISVNSSKSFKTIAKNINSFGDIMENNVIASLDNLSEGNANVFPLNGGANDELTPALEGIFESAKGIADDSCETLDAIVNGDFERNCSAEIYKGFNKPVADKINSLISQLYAPVNEINTVLEKVAKNDFTTKVSGDYSGIFKIIADEVNSLVDSQNVLADTIIRASNADTALIDELNAKGALCENDRLTPAVLSMMNTINDVVNEAKTLHKKVEDGEFLNYHIDTERYNGSIKALVEGLNGVVESFSLPLKDVAQVLTAFNNHDFDKACTADYKGFFAEITKRLNTAGKDFKALVGIADAISRGSNEVEDGLRAKLAETPNDNVLNVFMRMEENINAMIKKTSDSANAVVNGTLDFRVKTEGFEGKYLTVAETLNRMLEAAEAPIKEIVEVSKYIRSTGKISFDITGDYKGSYKELCDALTFTMLSSKKAIAATSDQLLKIADGDYSSKGLRDFLGDYAPLSDSINKILKTSNILLGTVKETAAQVAVGATQTADGSQLLSQGTTEQASTVEELNSTIAEVAHETKTNALNAGTAKDVVIKVKDSADNGNTQMNHMLTSMEDISASSKNISKIIKVIEDIAFQTNILALNAAVEAARAGTSGKGFSVVADEVRNLANKSSEAAKESAAMIDSTLKKIAEGTANAKDTAKSFTDIVDGIKKVSGLVSDIASASNEQATSIAEINKGLEQVSAIIQTNSSTAEESAAASEELSSHANLLNSQVLKFNLRGSDMAHESFASSKKETAPAKEYKFSVAGTKLEEKKVNRIPAYNAEANAVSDSSTAKESAAASEGLSSHANLSNSHALKSNLKGSDKTHGSFASSKKETAPAKEYEFPIAETKLGEKKMNRIPAYNKAANDVSDDIKLPDTSDFGKY